MEIRVCSVGPWPMNAYVLVCPSTRQSVLIDPGADPDVLSATLAGTTPIAILLTHTHPDHVGALDEMRMRLQVPLMANDSPHYAGMDLQADRWLNHGAQIRVGEHQLRALRAPGHTADMLCYAVEQTPHIIVGDTIFAAGPGRTWSTQDFHTTLQTLRTVVLSWPDDTICYPGHGEPFRLGDVRMEIEEFLSRDHGDFFGDATWDMGAGN